VVERGPDNSGGVEMSPQTTVDGGNLDLQNNPENQSPGCMNSKRVKWSWRCLETEDVALSQIDEYRLHELQDSPKMERLVYYGRQVGCSRRLQGAIY
jgi:hypothetical protein